jgi:hypothetical protein
LAARCSNQDPTCGEIFPFVQQSMPADVIKHTIISPYNVTCLQQYELINNIFTTDIFRKLMIWH